MRRPLSIGKALDDALVALEMNGEPLPPDHGFPARLIVPGWIGIASIKWLGRIEVADTPLASYWNTTQYRFTGGEYPPDSPPLTEQVVKSAWELPRPATLAAGVPGDAARAVLVRPRPHPACGGVERRGRHVAPRPPARAEPPAGVGAVEHPVARTRRRGPTSCSPGRPTTAGTPSPTRRRSTRNGYLFGAVVRHPLTVS